MKHLYAFLLREWMLATAAAGLFLTSLFLKRLPLYQGRDFEVIFILFVYLVLIRGLERARFFAALAAKISSGRAGGVKLVLGVFFLSMLITNDAALLIGVPLALKAKLRRKDLLIISLALAANAGSALTPFGNPQNLFIYWFYHLHFWSFLKTIFPLVLVSGLGVGILSFVLWGRDPASPKEAVSLLPRAHLYGLAFGFFVLVVLRVFPLWVGGLILTLALILDPSSLKIDYPLLLTFFCFFGFTDNLMAMFDFQFEDPQKVFLGSAIASQFISNVPAALLFCDFTHNWSALLWGVNVGGFGNLIGSLANLIAFRFYVQAGGEEKPFLLRFHLLGYAFFLTGVGLYFLYF